MTTSPSIPFVGPSYQLARKNADDQRVINMHPTAIESGSGKSGVFLQSVPGLKLFGKVVTYYTSTIYPVLFTDQIHTPVPTLQRGNTILFADNMTTPVAGIVGGTLVTSIHYLEYLNKRDVNPDTMTTPLAVLLSGSLTVTAGYKTYTDSETMSTPVPGLLSGSLVVVISYLTYSNKRDINPDTMTTPVSTLIGGTLT